MGFKMRTLRLPKARTEEDLLAINGSSLKKFTWRELKLATSNFNKKNMVGRGGFGSVYRGHLEDNSLVAIKRCHKKRDHGEDLQFQAEVEIGGCQASDHGNILRLRGYCMTRQERLLVYPFMVNGSVASRLWERPRTMAPLDWDARKRIALGAAKGLAHFHCGSSFTVIHRDMKASNILLDNEFEAVLCDFGLAKFVGRDANERNSGWLQKQIEEDADEDEEDDSSDEDRNSFTYSCWNFTRTFMVKTEDHEIQTKGSAKMASVKRQPTVHPNGGGTEPAQVSGTLGYLAPEYYAADATTSSLQTDVYGYGVVLLELISGRRAFDPARREKDDNVLLPNWAKKLVGDNKSKEVVDPELRRGKGLVMKEMEQLLKLALLCTSSTPQDRPPMPEVIKKIESIGKRTNHVQLSSNRSPQRFSLHQLELATDNFSTKNVIGSTRCTNLYRGQLQEDDSSVIVSRMIHGSNRCCRRQFQGELKFGRIVAGSHPNMLQMRGYCDSENQKCIVYPFMANRSLEWRLRPERSRPLDWTQRKNIALGVAKGVAYLHYHYDSKIITSIHRHVKPSNILLDDDFNSFLYNLRIRHNNGGDDDNDETAIAFSSIHNDVYRFGMTLLVLICGHKVTDLLAWAASNHDNSYTDLGVHDCLQILGRHGQHLSVDPLSIIGDKNYDSLADIKDEVEQLMQVALLCTQPCPLDRPEMSEVIKMLQGISQGRLHVCSAFDRASLFRYGPTPMEPPQPKPSHEFEIKTDNQIKPEPVPQLDAPAPVATNSSHLPNILNQDSGISSKGNEAASFASKPSIFTWDKVEEPKMEDRWKNFLFEIVSDALPTKSKLCQSGMSNDPLCPLCKKFEEDNLHLFFKCEFSNRVWQLAMVMRMDVLGFGSAKEAVDAILRPEAGGVGIPWYVEPRRFTHNCVAVMYSIWTHRNKVCFEKVSPKVREVVSSSQEHFHQHKKFLLCKRGDI